jgi:REP element-mobilizing transposase RayT
MKTRTEQFWEGALVHIVHRGVRGSEIVKDYKDRVHFLKALYFLNDKATDENWKQDIQKLITSSDLVNFEEVRKKVGRWKERETYVDILAYCLMSNHFHLFIYIKDPKDVGRFMQRLSISLAMRFNKKYNMKGTLFESKYKVSIINNELHMDLVIPYIIYKNPCELFKGGIKSANTKPEKAFQFASQYTFCSLGDLLYKRPQSAIINTDRLYGNFEIPKTEALIRKWCIDYLKNRPETTEIELE